MRQFSNFYRRTIIQLGEEPFPRNSKCGCKIGVTVLASVKLNLASKQRAYQTTTTTAMRTSPNERLNNQSNKSSNIVLPSSAKQQREMTRFVYGMWTTTAASNVVVGYLTEKI